MGYLAPMPRPYRLTLASQRLGGYARALSLTPRRRREIGRLAALARWGKPKKAGKKRANGRRK